MVHAGLSDINTTKSKKKLTVKQERAKAEHNVWLKQQGLLPEQISIRKSSKKSKTLRLNFSVNNGPECSNGFANGGFKTSVFDSEWNRRYEDDPKLAERETIALKKAEALKGDLMPLYNKGPIQLKSKKLKMTELGKRR